MESVKKVPEGIKGDPTRPLGEKPTKSKENLPEAPLGPRHASLCKEDVSTSRLLAERVKQEKEEKRFEKGKIELEWVELELSWGWSGLNMERQVTERVRVE